MFVLSEIKKVQLRAIHATLHNLKCFKYYFFKNVTVNSLNNPSRLTQPFTETYELVGSRHISFQT